MNTKTLEGKLKSASSRERQLITWLLDAPAPLQQSLSEALLEMQKKTKRGQLLEYVIDFTLQASTKTALTQKTENKANFEEMVDLFTQPEILKLFAPDTNPLAAARLRGLQVKKELLYGSDQPLTSEQVAHLLGITRQAVDKRRSKGQILGLSLGKRGYLYPSWQFQQGKILQGLEQVLAVMAEFDPWTQLMFLLTGDIRLEGQTPLECLIKGEIEAVIQAAECYGNHGAA